MHVSIIGSGYVGTTVAACLADLGHEVVNIDIEESIVESINSGEAPIHEPGLQELIDENPESLRATTDYSSVVETDVSILCLPTPSREDGNIDTKFIEAGAESLGQAISEKDGSHVVATKSTVIPSTNEEVIAPILERESGKKVGDDLGIVMNPEFQREGSAVHDFLNPDKIVIGASDEESRDVMHELYAPLVEDTTVVDTGVKEAEMIKYANNTFLASKVSLVNELGNICKEHDIDTYEVMDAVGLDHRISSNFLRSGLGWGGSCFPKDTNALRRVAESKGYDPSLLNAVFDVNDKQPKRLVKLLEKHVEIEDSEIGVLGLSFKPGTDDVRNSRAIDVIELLIEKGAKVKAYDPEAIEKAREVLERSKSIEYTESAENALKNSEAALITTDWPEFNELDFSRMARKVVIDGRRIDVDRDKLEVYEGLCW